MRPGPRKVTWRAVAPIAILVPLLLIGVGTWYWISGPAALPADEARAALAGNTVAGGWGDERTGYRQYFGADGTTLYAPEGEAPRPGTWAVEEDGRVCSRIEGIPLRCHKVGREEQVLYWIDDQKNLGFPFAVLPGEQLSEAPLSDDLGRWRLPLG